MYDIRPFVRVCFLRMNKIFTTPDNESINAVPGGLPPSQKAVMKGIFTASFSALALVVLYGALHHDSTHIDYLAAIQNARAQTMLHELNDIHHEFLQLENDPQSAANLKTALADMNNHLDKIQSGLTSMQTDVDAKMTDLQQAVSNNPNTRTYLDAKNLPFTLVSVDVISEQPFVSVNYDHHVLPLGIGDTLGGWNLISADYDQSTAIFKNAHDQYVQVIIKNP